MKDFYYLTKHNATYAENFYELEREGKQKRKFAALKSALIWTVLPYIFNKIEAYFNKIK